MRIAGVGARPPASDHVAGALEGAVALLGQRPAVTGLIGGERREQGFASLAGWVAKGANLLTTELGLGPGDRMALGGPPGWPLAAVALSAWWAGLTVVPLSRSGDAAVTVAHAGLDLGTGARSGELLRFGDALDGTGVATRDEPNLGEQWTDAVTPHGDRPPAPARDATLVAFAEEDGEAWTQQALLGLADDGQDGALGLLRHGDADVLAAADGPGTLAVLALRPLVTGTATVVLDAEDPDRAGSATAERVTHLRP